MRMTCLFLVLILASPVAAQKKSTVILPDISPPAPLPVPPSTPQPLGANQLFVVRSEVPCVILTSPAGLTKLSAETGPVKIRAVFVGGPGTFETKTFSEKNVYTLEAAGNGQVELLIVPQGAAGEADVIRRTLLVSGNGPLPPPGPPPAPANPLTATFQTAFNLDADADRAASLNFLKLVYRSLAVGALTSGKATNADFAAWIRAAIEAPVSGLTAAQIINLRKAIGAEFAAAWGTKVSPLDPKDAAAEIQKVAEALAGVK